MKHVCHPNVTSVRIESANGKVSFHGNIVFIRCSLNLSSRHELQNTILSFHMKAPDVMQMGDIQILLFQWKKTCLRITYTVQLVVKAARIADWFSCTISSP